jgi:hypothetical protein
MSHAAKTNQSRVPLKLSRPGRVAGSCRFDPYCKVEVWDAQRFCFRVIQKAHSDADAARSWARLSLAKGDKFRVSTITEEGRTFSESEVLK